MPGSLDSPTPPTPPNFPAAASSLKPSPAPGRFRFSKVFCRWWWLAALLVVGITYAVSMVPKWMDMRGPLYESTALVEVQPITDASLTRSEDNSRFINTQLGVIKAPTTLEMALAKRDLLQRLGGDKEEARARMRKSLHITQRRGTDLIEISYRDEDPAITFDAASSVYEAYRDRREEMEMNLRREQLKFVEAELQRKRERAGKLKKDLLKRCEKAGVTLKPDGGFVLPDEQSRQALEKELFDATRKRDETAVQLKRLSVTDRESVLASAEALKDSNKNVKRAYDQYLLRESELNALGSAGLARAHPKTQRYTTRVEQAAGFLKTVVTQEIAATKARLVLEQENCRKIKQQLDAAAKRGVDAARALQEISLLRREFEMTLKIVDKFSEKLDIEKIKLRMPLNSIIVHEPPQQPSRPVTRGQEFVSSLATVCSLPFSIVLGILLMYFAELVLPRK